MMSNAMTSTPVYHQPARAVPVIADVDVLVVGGGPAGVCAAVAAARAGARTFLIERHGCLGGMWTAGMVLTLAGYNSWLRPYHRCVKGIPEEWIQRAHEMGGADIHSGFVVNSDPEAMKRAADDMITEAGVQILLHVRGADPILEGQAVRGLCIETVEGRQAIRAKVTIDCTGDGDVFARAGAAFEKSATLQPMTMAFRMGQVSIDSAIDIGAPVSPPIGPEPGFLRDPLLSQYASVRQDVEIDGTAMRAEREAGNLPVFGGPWFGGLDRDVVWVNSVRIAGDASNAADITRAEIQGRRDAARLAGYFTSHLQGFEQARLFDTGTQIGVRETRRLAGRYVLTGTDILERSEFHDAVALGCWPIDVHPADGQAGHHGMYVPLPYHIPYRSLLPQDVDGLIVAGRCFSADREALGSARVGATCAAMGQAAGAAAALAAAAGIEPVAVEAAALQNLLRSQGALVDYPELAEV